VVLAAPLATLVVYLVDTRGNLVAFAQHPGRIAGFMWIAGTALVIGMVLALGALVRERDARARSLELQFQLERAQFEKQAVDARLALLTAQIEPHFLFNTLANIQALVESGSPRAPEVLKSLIAYLRAALPRLHEGGQPSLANELALVRAYLELMHLRMPDRLQFSVDVPAELQARRFPAMALLTLVENAVKHGIDPGEEGGRIDVGGALEAAGHWRLWVADTGVGLAQNAAPGTGLANLRDRLQGLFGPDARLELSEVSPHGVRAEILIPESEP
jgi:LytS/YehU family sensor histidine kinase